MKMRRFTTTPSPSPHDAELDIHPLGSSQLAKGRKEMFKATAMGMVMVFLTCWVALPIFWGSCYTLLQYFYRLDIDIYDFDSIASPGTALLGPTLSSSLVATMASTTHVTFNIKDPATAGAGGGMITMEEIENQVVNEVAWATVVINSNASTAWRSAVAGTGGTTYDPEGAVTLVVASARFYQVIDEYLVPYLKPLMQSGLQTASQAAVADELSSLTLTQLVAFSEAQQKALSTPFGMSDSDVRPILPGQWAGSAPLEAGLIYYIVFAFHLVIFLYNGRTSFAIARQKHGVALTFPHVILLRLVPEGILYFILSLWYSLINVAFGVPMDGNGHSGLTYGQGFMVFWMLNWITMAALALAMESMVTLLTLKFFTPFLLLWMVLNISSSFFPPDLMGPFYRYGYAMPFWHSTTADKFIFWGTRNRLGLNFGVLAGWVVLSICSITLFELLNQKRVARTELKELEREKERTEGDDGEHGEEVAREDAESEYQRSEETQVGRAV
ncbi:hypothetical protein MNV49_002498 [Pseudohyphozyma bogoriensis]|nr:hypothetical protein MNV49_002498 [Pseudohyphozyma bogoriensis]